MVRMWRTFKSRQVIAWAAVGHQRGVVDANVDELPADLDRALPRAAVAGDAMLGALADPPPAS